MSLQAPVKTKKKPDLCFPSLKILSRRTVVPLHPLIDQGGNYCSLLPTATMLARAERLECRTNLGRMAGRQCDGGMIEEFGVSREHGTLIVAMAGPASSSIQARLCHLHGPAASHLGDASIRFRSIAGREARTAWANSWANRSMDC